MLISRNLHNKSSEVSIITRSPAASLSFKGQVTRHTTVKRSIYHYIHELFLTGQYKLQTADCRLGLKRRQRPKLSHPLIRDIFSIHDLYIGNKKLKSKPFNEKSQKVGML